jgi:DNA-binding transcriptional MerR regulator
MRIGDVAKRLGVSTATLRLWDERGLVRPGRTAGGSRRYGHAEVELLGRVVYLRRTKHMSLASIAEFVSSQCQACTDSQQAASVASDEDHQLGHRLRSIRKDAAFTLKQVSELTDLSVSFLSSLERGNTRPSISTIHKLTRVYGITVFALMDGLTNIGHMVRAESRPQLRSLESGVQIEQLASGAFQMEPQLFTLRPGANSGGAYSHIGEEFIYMLKGCLEIWLDEKEHHELNSGDCLYFPSTLSHRWQNPGPRQAVMLWVNTPPTF